MNPKLKKFLEGKIKHHEARQKEIKKLVEKSTDVNEVRSLNEEAIKLANEIREYQEQLDEVEADTGDDVDDNENRSANGNNEDEIRSQSHSLGVFSVGNGNGATAQQMEERGAALLNGESISIPFESRHVTVAGGTVLVPEHQSSTITESFQGVSSMVSKLNYVPLPGGESYSVPFKVGDEAGGYTDEGLPASDAEVQTDYVKTGRAKITAYAEITDEAKNLPAANYYALVRDSVRNSVLKKLAAQVVNGHPTDISVAGIYNSDVKVMPGTTDVTLDAIDESTLNTITFAYGGPEALEAEETLILSKQDLQEFSKVKTLDGKFVYQIKKGKGGSGTIGYKEGGLEVGYEINSAIRPFATATAGQATMVYGSLASYIVPVFSDMTVKESGDYKFKEGIIALKADIVCGGTVCKYNGFVRVMKGTPVLLTNATVNNPGVDVDKINPKVLEKAVAAYMAKKEKAEAAEQAKAEAEAAERANKAGKDD